MAINRIPYPSSTPTAVSDYEAQNALLVAALGEGNNVVPFIGTAMSIGFVFNVGGVVYRVDTATSITGTASPYVKITPSGATASASFSANLTGVTYNNVWNGYYDGSGNRYFFDEVLANSTGVVSSINSGFSPYLVKNTSSASLYNGYLYEEKANNFTIDDLDIGEIISYRVVGVTGTAIKCYTPAIGKYKIFVTKTVTDTFASSGRYEIKEHYTIGYGVFGPSSEIDSLILLGSSARTEVYFMVERIS